MPESDLNLGFPATSNIVVKSLVVSFSAIMFTPPVVLLLSANLICVFSLQNGYIDVLKNINELPKLVEKHETSESEMKHVVDMITDDNGLVNFGSVETLLDAAGLDGDSSISGLCINQSRALFTAVIQRRAWALKSKRVLYCYSTQGVVLIGVV